MSLSFNTLRALTVCCFSYSSHVTVLPIFSELSRPSAINGYRFTNWAFSVSFVLVSPKTLVFQPSFKQEHLLFVCFSSVSTPWWGSLAT